MAEDLDQNFDETPPTNPKLPLILGLVVGLALGGAGAAAYFLFTPGDESADPAAQLVKEKPYTPYYLDLDQIRGPLMTKDRERVLGYAELDIQIEVAEEDNVEYLEMREPLLRHAANQVLTQNGVSTPEKPRQIDFERVSADLTKAFNTALKDPMVKTVHIVKGTRI